MKILKVPIPILYAHRNVALLLFYFIIVKHNLEFAVTGLFIMYTVYTVVIIDFCIFCIFTCVGNMV